MILQKSIKRFLVASLFVIFFFFSTMTNSFANSSNTIITANNTQEEIKQTIANIDEPLNLSTSKVLLDNNNALDQIVKSSAFTLNGIMESQTESPIGQKDYSTKEIEMMAKMVNGEARGESLKGKVAVAAVILNRVESPKFPDTVGNVLFEDGAFTAVIDGQYNKSPDYSSYEAVYLAINGMDPTEEALFYYNPSIATSEWIFSRPTTTEIGQHVFAK